MLSMDEIVIELPPFFRENAFHLGDVKTLDFLQAGEFVEAAERFAGAGKEDKTRDRFVEAMDRMEKNIARFVVLLLDPLLRPRFERIAANRIGLRQETRRLIGH